MLKKFLCAAVISAAATMLFAEEAAATPEVPDVMREEFNNSRRYVTVKMQTHDAKGKPGKQISDGCRKEYKDGILALYYKRSASNNKNDYGVFSFGVASRLDMKGSNKLAIRYRLPERMSSQIVWTYADANGKLNGGWIKLPNATDDWQEFTVELDRSSATAKKRAAAGNPLPPPVKLVALQIYSYPKADDVEKSIEIDYISVPGVAAEAK